MNIHKDASNSSIKIETNTLWTQRGTYKTSPFRILSPFDQGHGAITKFKIED